MKLEWTDNHGQIGACWFVYAMFCVDLDRPLYIGMTQEPIKRLSVHRDKKVWWCAVDRIVLTTYETEAEARAGERDYIRRANPIHNIERYEIEASA
jgi:predicted GIY-YIG superfamily endonuclease